MKAQHNWFTMTDRHEETGKFSSNCLLDTNKYMYMVWEPWLWVTESNGVRGRRRWYFWIRRFKRFMDSWTVKILFERAWWGVIWSEVRACRKVSGRAASTFAEVCFLSYESFVLTFPLSLSLSLLRSIPTFPRAIFYNNNPEAAKTKGPLCKSCMDRKSLSSIIVPGRSKLVDLRQMHLRLCLSIWMVGPQRLLFCQLSQWQLFWIIWCAPGSLCLEMSALLYRSLFDEVQSSFFVDKIHVIMAHPATWGEDHRTRVYVKSKCWASQKKFWRRFHLTWTFGLSTCCPCCKHFTLSQLYHTSVQKEGLCQKGSKWTGCDFILTVWNTAVFWPVSISHRRPEW